MSPYVNIKNAVFLNFLSVFDDFIFNISGSVDPNSINSHIKIFSVEFSTKKFKCLFSFELRISSYSAKNPEKSEKNKMFQFVLLDFFYWALDHIYICRYM